MKKRFVYIGSIIILIISVLTFVVFGFGTEVFTSIFGNGNKTPVFGKYDGKKIEYAAGTDFANEASQLAENYKNQGYELNTQAEYYIFSQAFNRTLMNMAFTSAVEKSGYIVPTEAVNREMIPYFSDANGKYSPKIFNQTDDATKDSMRKEFTNNLTYSRYVDDILGLNTTSNEYALYGIKSSEKETSFLASMNSAKRSFNLTSFDTANFPSEEAATWGKSNAELFIKYDISVVTLDEEKEAKSLLAQIKNNEVTFADAVSEKSAKYYSDADGKLASPYNYQITNMMDSEDDIPAVTGLAKDAMSDVIKTKRGYSIFLCNGDSKAADFADTEVLDVVTKYMKANESGYIENYYTQIAKNFALEAALNGFDGACTKFNVAKTEVPAFPLNYGSSSLMGTIPSTVADLSGASSNENVLKNAFSLKLNEISEPMVLGTKVIVLQLTGIQNDEPASSDSLADSIATIDQSSVQSTLLASDKVENNFTEVFFDFFMNTAQ